MPTLNATGLRAAACRRSFATFVREFWDVVCPGRELLWDWHIQLMCHPATTRVFTSQGWQTIRDIVWTTSPVYVLSFNHSQSKLEWKKVIGGGSSPGRKTLELRVGESSVEMTEDHPVYVQEKGYTAAGAVRPGDATLQLRVLQEDIRQEVSVEPPANLFPQLCLQENDRRCRREEPEAMCRLWAGVCSQVGEASGQSILQPGLLRQVFAKAGEPVSDLQQAVDSPEKSNLSVLLLQKTQVRAAGSLHWLPEGDLPHSPTGCGQGQEEVRLLLQSRLLRTDGGGRGESGLLKRELVSSDEVFKGVLAGTQESFETGSSEVCSLRPCWSGVDGHPSRRLGQDEQLRTESHHPLSSLSRGSEGGWDYRHCEVGESVVSSVESTARIPEEVYHIEVEGNKNYFAEGVLVHNCDSLQEIAERVFRGEPKKFDQVTNISRGTTKSTVHSIMFPAWVWANMPHARVIGASYSDDLALTFSLKNRDVVKSERYRAYFPEVEIRPDQDTKSKFYTTAGGSRSAVGSGGTVQGTHADFIVIDDPLDPNRAMSEAELGGINHWIENTLSGCVTDKAVSVIVLVMQRLHQDDPTARMVERNEEGKPPKVRWYRIPATTEFEVHPPELEAKYADGLMSPRNLPKEFLDAKRSPKEMGEAGFASQYGQTPVPAGGAMFKVDKLRWGPVPAKFKYVMRFWDKAATSGKEAKKNKSPFTAGVKLAKDFDGRFWVLNSRREHLDSGSRERYIAATAREDGRGVEVGVEQEPGSGGKDSAIATVRRLAGYICRILIARGTKEMRADEFSVQVNAGNVWLPEDQRRGDSWCGWAKEYVDELMHFPFSRYKDQVDGSSGAFHFVAKGKIRVGTLQTRKQRERLVDAQEITV